jgi:uncharacterized membrane protein YdbT with pleckstrin-like domain
MDLHAGEQIIFQGHPSWRSTIQFYLGGLLVAVVAGVLAALIEDTGLGVLVGLGILAVVLVVGWVKRLSTDYMVTTERLHIRKGIVARNVQETRVERVQNVNTSQNVLQRILQVGTVDFDTAGTDDYQFQFTGVAQPEHVVAAVDRAQRAHSQGAGASALSAQ